MLASAASLLGGTGAELEALGRRRRAAAAHPRLASLRRGHESTRRAVAGMVLRSILAVLDPFLSKIFPVEGACSTPARAFPTRIRSSRGIRAVAAALGMPSSGVYRGEARETRSLLLTEPRAMVLGTDFLVETGRPVRCFMRPTPARASAGDGSIYALPRAAWARAARRGEQARRRRPARPRPPQADQLRLAAEEQEGPRARRLAAQPPPTSPRRAPRLGGRGDAPRAPSPPSSSPATYAPSRRCSPRTRSPPPPTSDRRRASQTHPRLREVLDFTVSSACWDVFKRVYGRS